MPKFEFNAAIYVRTYGTITVHAETLDAAKAAMVADGFNMEKAFSPHGGGEDDFDYNCTNQAIFLNTVIVDDGDETELDIEVLDANETADAQRLQFVSDLGETDFAGIFDFTKRMANFTTPEMEFNDETEEGEALRKQYSSAEEYEAEMSDDRLCDEFGVFKSMIEQARDLVKS